MFNLTKFEMKKFKQNKKKQKTEMMICVLSNSAFWLRKTRTVKAAVSPSVCWISLPSADLRPTANALGPRKTQHCTER